MAQSFFKLHQAAVIPMNLGRDLHQDIELVHEMRASIDDDLVVRLDREVAVRSLDEVALADSSDLVRECLLKLTWHVLDHRVRVRQVERVVWVNLSMRSGRARILREHSDGRAITLTNVGPGEIFGELAMLGGEVRSATVETLEYVEAVAILADDLSFRGPLGQFDDADECVRAMRGLAQMTTDIVVRKVFADAADVLTWFELHTMAAPPCPVANWSHIEQGKIDRIRVAFDPRPLLGG